MRQKKLKVSETSKVIADEIRREMAKSKEDPLLNAYLDNLEEFIMICGDMTTEAITRNKFSKVYEGDVDEIVQQICYLMLNKGVSREMFEKSGTKMYSYVYTMIKSCIVRLSHGRGKYGDGYVLR